MHNIIKRLLIITVLTVIIPGCALDRVNVETSVSEYETNSEQIHIETPQITGLTDEEFQDNINLQYDETIKSMLDTFLEESQNTIDERDGKGKFELKQNVVYNKNNLLSIVGECFRYTTGINGTSTRIVKNINTYTNQEILLSDLFNDDEYKAMLNQKLEKQYEQAEYSDLWEKPVIGDDQEYFFYFTDEGIVIFYPPYELSYYARGFVEFTVTYAELYGYLKPEYSHLY